MHNLPPHYAHIHTLVPINVHQALMNVSEYKFFPCGGIQWDSFVSSTHPCQMAFCHTVPLLLSFTWQQNVAEYWWESLVSIAVPPPWASAIVGQHKSIGSITFRAALVESKQIKCTNLIEISLLPTSIFFNSSYWKKYYFNFNFCWFKNTKINAISRCWWKKIGMYCGLFCLWVTREAREKGKSTVTKKTT